MCQHAGPRCPSLSAEDTDALKNVVNGRHVQKLKRKVCFVITNTGKYSCSKSRTWPENCKVFRCSAGEQMAR